MKIKNILLTLVATIFCANLALAKTAEYDRIETLDETEKMAWFWGKKDQEKELAKKEKVAKKKTVKEKKKAQEKAVKTKKKEKKLQIKESKKAQEKARKQVKVAKKTVKKEKVKTKKIQKGETCPLKYKDEDAVDRYVNQWREDLAQYQNEERQTRCSLIKNWKNIRKQEVSQDYADGMYSDLYKLPTWPFEALFAEHKSLLNIKYDFDYQTSSYGPNGSKGDLSKLHFGYDPVRLRDILLAFKLGVNDVVNDADLQSALMYLKPNDVITNRWMQDKDNIYFLAESQEHRTSINYSRYIVGDNILIGFDLPIAYKKHILKVSFDEYNLNDTNINYIFQREQWFKTAFEEVLELKDLKYVRKNSITGIGDLNLFANVNIRSRFFDKANWGFKLQLPISKRADKTKLWAPVLGEECVKFSGHVAMLWGPKEWFNPHFLIQGTYAASAHVSRRIPRKVKNTDVNMEGTPPAPTNWKNEMVLGDKIRPFAPAGTFTEWDTTTKGMADEARNISLQQGPELFVRLGNIFEKALFRRGFLDIYYDLRIKGDDSASDLPEDDYNLEIVENHTNEIENNIGLNFSYQFDYHTRLQLGGRYTLFGRNVPQHMQLSCNLGIEF